MNFFRKFILIVENTPEKKPVTGKLGETYSNIMGFIIPLKITDTPYLRVPISKTSNDLTVKPVHKIGCFNCLWDVSFSIGLDIVEFI